MESADQSTKEQSIDNPATDPSHLLSGLDSTQRLAVTSTAQPLAILAGAGSGKTRVLTRRIAYRCTTGSADPRHVMAVTFTRKAASELDARLSVLGLRDLPAAGTFHALAYAQLRTAWSSENRAAPTLLDRKGRVLSRILANTKTVRVVDLATEIEWAKARLITPETYVEAVTAARRQPPGNLERFAEWYLAYQRELNKRGLVDFDDLLALCADRLERDVSFASAQRWRFRHLFVDEYQDVNPLQERLLRAWLGDRSDLCVVGDPNQAIYSWNGADAGFLRDFVDRHTGAEVIRLGDSYRSTPQVLGVAAAILGEPAPHAHRGDGPLPVIVGYKSDRDEANGVARAVREHHRPGMPWSSQAVLIRTNAQAALFEQAFRRAAIPYRLKGASSLLDQLEVRELLKRLDRLKEPLTTSIEDLAESLARQTPDAATEVDPAVARRNESYGHLVRLGREMLVMDPTARTDAFSGWLRTVLLEDNPDGADAVTIASFHAAKGLEWDVVHIAGCEAGYVPISHARTPEARSEEERLFYVAATRAAEVLRYTWARQRTFTEDPVERSPSPLLLKVRESIGHMERTQRIAPDAALRLHETRRALEGPTTQVTGRLGVDDPASTDDDVGSDEAATRAIAADLRKWRSEQARRAGVRPTVVLSDKALDAVARHQPRTPRDLEDLAGLGPFTRDRHGARLLEAVATHTDRGSSLR